MHLLWLTRIPLNLFNALLPGSIHLHLPFSVEYFYLNISLGHESWLCFVHIPPETPGPNITGSTWCEGQSPLFWSSHRTICILCISIAGVMEILCREPISVVLVRSDAVWQSKPSRGILTSYMDTLRQEHSVLLNIDSPVYLTPWRIWSTEILLDTPHGIPKMKGGGSW